MTVRRRAHRSLLALTAAAVIPLTMTLSTSTANAAPTETVVAACPAGLPIAYSNCGTSYTVGTSSSGFQEIRGEDRYATAAEAARQGYSDADIVVLVSGESSHLVDALSAAPLARSLAAPVLLTEGQALPAATAAVLTAHTPKAVLVIGDAKAISDAVITRLNQLGINDVGRISGLDRYATSRAVASYFTGASHAWVASGDNAHLVDALAASGPAARLGEPLVLAPPAGDASATATRLRSAGITTTTVAGGENAASPAVAAQFPRPARDSGDSRFTTAKAIADDAVSRGVSRTDIVVTSGENNHLVDALAAAPLGRLTLLTGGGGAGTDIVTAWLAAGKDRTTFVGAAANDLVCWGAVNCARVATTDVTGDAVADDIALVGRTGDLTQQVRVRTNGTVASATVDTGSSEYAQPWLGTSAVDNVAGQELLILATLGAHVEPYTMLTWRDNQLVVEAAPGSTEDDPAWYVDASLNLNTSVTCDGPGDVTVRWTDTDEQGNHYGARQPYRYENGTWSEVGDLVVENLPNGPTSQYSGWYCAGLPRFATFYN